MSDFKKITNELPISGTALDVLKLLAAAFMVIDHMDDILFDRTMPVMLLIGRVVFPIFCFATMAAILRGGLDSAKTYAVRLLVLAVFVEPISQISRQVDVANILFTLAIGAALIPYVYQASHRMRIMVFTVGILALWWPDQWEYGILGAFIPSVMYLVMKEDRGERYIPWLILMLALFNFGDISQHLIGMSEELLAFMVVVMCVTIFGPWLLIISARHIQGEKRIMPKYFLHIFYPAHLIILAVINEFV